VSRPTVSPTTMQTVTWARAMRLLAMHDATAANICYQGIELLTAGQLRIDPEADR